MQWNAVFVVLLMVSVFSFAILLGTKSSSSSCELPSISLTRTDVPASINDENPHLYKFDVTTDAIFGGSFNYTNANNPPILTKYENSITFFAYGRPNSEAKPTYSVYVTAENDSGFNVASYQFSITCFMEDVLLITSRGGIQAQNLLVGDLILQPSGVYSKICNVKKTEVNEHAKMPDGRIFSDESGNVRVTYWHQVKLEKWEFAGKSSLMHEIFPARPFTVYHFELEKKEDVIQVQDSDIVLESWYQ